MLSRNVACRLLRQRSCRSLPNSLGREFSQSCDDNNDNRDGIRRGRNFSTSVYPKARRQRQRDFFGKEKSLRDMAEENELGLSKFKIRDSIRVGGKDDLRFAHDYSAKVPVRSIYIASNIEPIFSARFNEWFGDFYDTSEKNISPSSFVRIIYFQNVRSFSESIFKE